MFFSFECGFGEFKVYVWRSGDDDYMNVRVGKKCFCVCVVFYIRVIFGC